MRPACVLFDVRGIRWGRWPGRMPCTELCVWPFWWVCIYPIRLLWAQLLRIRVACVLLPAVHRRGLVVRVGAVGEAVAVVRSVVAVRLVVVVVVQLGSVCRLVPACLHAVAA